MNRLKLSKLVAMSSVYILAGGPVGAVAQSAAVPPASAPSATASSYGESVRASHWSSQGASHALAGLDMRSSLPPPAATGNRPPVTTPAAAGFGLTTAASHGGLGIRGHLR